jgi:hypothetical protein
MGVPDANGEWNLRRATTPTLDGADAALHWCTLDATGAGA